MASCIPRDRAVPQRTYVGTFFGHREAECVKRSRLLAIASAGGHWKELVRLRDAPRGSYDVTWVTTDRGYAGDVEQGQVSHGDRGEPLGSLAARTFRRRGPVDSDSRTPRVVVTTGAAPGFFALWLGKKLGAKTVWIDSFANGDELSLSGQRAGAHADVWLTQWPDLARPDGPEYAGECAVIFVTVGSQLPFDRLVHAVDAWARDAGRSDVFGQVGATSAPPSTIEWASELTPSTFEERVGEADVVVGHAGTGTIMAALDAGTPVVVLARREALGETRSDHQVATTKRFAEHPGVFCAAEASEVGDLIERALAFEYESQVPGAAPDASLVERLERFFDAHLERVR